MTLNTYIGLPYVSEQFRNTNKSKNKANVHEKNEKRGTITTAVCIKHLHTQHKLFTLDELWPEIPKAATPFPLKLFSSFIRRSLIRLFGSDRTHRLKALCGSWSDSPRMVSPVLKWSLMELGQPWLAICAFHLYFVDIPYTVNMVWKNYLWSKFKRWKVWLIIICNCRTQSSHNCSQ